MAFLPSRVTCGALHLTRTSDGCGVLMPAFGVDSALRFRFPGVFQLMESEGAILPFQRAVANCDIQGQQRKCVLLLTSGSGYPSASYAAAAIDFIGPWR